VSEIPQALRLYNRSCIIPGLFASSPPYTDSINGWAGIVYNAHAIGFALSRSTDIYEKAVRQSDFTFFVVLVVTVSLLVVVFTVLPCFLYCGLK